MKNTLQTIGRTRPFTYHCGATSCVAVLRLKLPRGSTPAKKQEKISKQAPAVSIIKQASSGSSWLAGTELGQAEGPGRKTHSPLS